MPLVFTYGPDTVQGRMYDRIGPSDVVGAGVLQGFALVFDKPNHKNKDEGLPNLEERADASTFGLLFDLTPKQLELFDGFFGGYERRDVRVRLADPEVEKTMTARTWVARRTKTGLKPSASQVEATRQGMEENGADPAFLEALKDLEVLDE